MLNFYTHAGRFHADEVIAFAICKGADICNNFVRITDINNIPTDGLVADIGRKYSPKDYKFDHHQGKIQRPTGGYYASAGLVWKEFGVKFVTNHLVSKRLIISYHTLKAKSRKQVTMIEQESSVVKKIVDLIDNEFIRAIDAHDADSNYSIIVNDSSNTTSSLTNVMTFSEYISLNNEDDIYNNDTQKERFYFASELSRNLLEKLCIKYFNQVMDEEMFGEAVNKDLSTDTIIVLDKFVNWKSSIFNKYTDCVFVVSPSQHPGNKYSMTAVPKNAETREVRIPINRSSKFKGFIHEGKWIAGSNDISELIDLANWNIANFDSNFVESF